MIKRTLLMLLFGVAALAMACGTSSNGEKPQVTPTSRPPAEPASASSNVGPDGNLLPEPADDLALTAALEAISGFDVSNVSFRGSDVTVKYDQVVNEPAELLLMRWIDFASVAVTFLDDPTGDIVLVPQVEQSDIASVRIRAVDVIDYLDGKRGLDELLAGIEIN